MDRLTFLRSMLGNTALLTLPPLHLLPREEQDRLAWTEDCHHIFVFDDYVRGFRFHEGAKVLHRIKDLDILDLVREHDNEHDPNAVAVYWEGHKLGYLPMGENVSLAYMLDHGLLLECSVVYTQPEEPPWEQCFIAVHLLVPSNPSFDAYIDHYMDRPDAGFKRRPEFGGMVERPDADEPLAEGPRTLKGAAALQCVGEARFLGFVLAVVRRMADEGVPDSMRALKAELDRQGLNGLRKLVTARGADLRVRQLGTDAFHIHFGQLYHGQGDGGEWEVRYRPDGTVEHVGPGMFWRT